MFVLVLVAIMAVVGAGQVQFVQTLNDGHQNDDTEMTQRQMQDIITRMDQEITLLQEENAYLTHEVDELKSKDMEHDDDFETLKSKDMEHDDNFETLKSKDMEHDDNFETLKSKDMEHDDNFDTLQQFVDVVATPVAFSALISPSFIYPAPGDTIVFDHVLSNYGDGYNATTGEFTCPATAIYMFAVNIYDLYDDYNYVSLYMDDDLVARIYTGRGSYGKQGSSNTVIVTCNKDSVVRAVFASGVGDIKGAFSSSFSGTQVFYLF